MTEEFDPCPFCNGSAHTQCWLGCDGNYHANVKCDECGASSGICSNGDEGVVILIAKVCWNTRYKRTCHKVPGKMGYQGRKVICSECGYGLGDSRWYFCPKCGAEICGAEALDD